MKLGAFNTLFYDRGFEEALEAIKAQGCSAVEPLVARVNGVLDNKPYRQEAARCGGTEKREGRPFGRP